MYTFQKRYVLLLSVWSFVALQGTAGKSSEEGTDKPLRNYFGTVEDVDGNTFTVEYIALNSKTTTSKIPVFMKPIDSSVDPRRNTTFLNLQDITEIRVAPYTKELERLRFKNTDYVTITVQFKGTSLIEHQYIIEANTRLWCEEVHDHAPVYKELQLVAVKRIVIKGFRSADIRPRSGHKQSVSQNEARKNRLCTKAAEDVRELQKMVEKLPAAEQPNAQQYVESLQNNVGGICSGT